MRRVLELADSGVFEIEGARLDYRFVGPQPGAAPTVVLLHEGLGSAGMWGSFPERLAAATGAGVLAYSRQGYGRSSPVPLPRPHSYMHDDALLTLPRVLDHIGFERGVLVGKSDGASIATIYAGHVRDDRIEGISLIAPHFIVEDQTMTGAIAAKAAYESGDLRARLARWHDHVDVAFYGWNQAWVDPAFKSGWSIVEALPGIRVPVQIVQGDRDEYGTIRQIELARANCKTPVEVTWMEGVGHAPEREAATATVEAIAGFARRVLAAAL